VDVIESLASLFGYRVARLPMKYLGFPLRAPYKSTTIWNGIVEKMERRLAGWKSLYLSKGGRLILIKSTLSNLPTYYLSLFPIPLGVANKIGKLQRHFLWGGLNEEFKFHLVKWSQICSPMQFGGLEIRNMCKFTQALLGKWLCQFTTKREVFWRLVVEAKYGCLNGVWCTKKVEGLFGVGVWKHIWWGWGVFLRFIRFEVGDGFHIIFWHDVWCGDYSLKDSFPEIFRIAQCKELRVRDNMQVSDDVIQWNVPFFTSCTGSGGRGCGCLFWDVVFS